MTAETRLVEVREFLNARRDDNARFLTEQPALLRSRNLLGEWTDVENTLINQVLAVLDGEPGRGAA